jgi:imidazolonepropionase
MDHADLIIHNAGQLVTCASGGKPKRGVEMLDVGIIENGAVAVTNRKIVGVGASSDILRDFSADKIIDVEGRVVCPGFVDPHTHIVFAGDRLNEFELKIKGADYLDILANGGGIISTVQNTRASSTNELVDLAMARLDKMLACGTTAVEIKTGYGLNTSTELSMLSAIEWLDLKHPVSTVPTFLAAHAVPPEYKDNGDSYVDLICDKMLPQAWHMYEDSHFPEKGVPFFIDVFCEKNAFDLEQTKRIFEAAKPYGFKLKAHVDEFTNLGGSRLAIEMGAVSVDHLDAISDDEIELLAESETIGIVTPTVNFNFGSTYFADARKLIDSGCALALSTDYNPGSAPCPSQPMAMAIACRYQRLLPAEAFNAATVNAAFAIGLGDRFGSLEPGKEADILIVDVPDYRQIANEFGGNLVKTVVKRGKVVCDR